MYDLEERTSFLWERSGWATSSVPGLALIVENTKDPENNNSFATLEDALDALPDVIRQPVMVEVLATGDLGKMELKNIKFGEGGSLEILNSVKVDIAASEYKAQGISIGDDSGNNYHIESIANRATGATPTSDWLDAAKSLVKSDVLGADYNLRDVGILPQLGTLPNSLDGGYFIAPIGSCANGTRPDRPSIYLHQKKNYSDNSSVWATNAGNNIVTKSIYDTDSNLVDPTKALDFTAPSKRNYVNGEVGSGQYVNGIWTNNVVRSIKVQNCEGPIYIRGFLVDGSDNRDLDNVLTFDKYGIYVSNSEGIVIEGCASVRNIEGGLLVKNSDVILNRKFFTGRNHKPVDGARQLVEHYGIKSFNSTLTLSSDAECNGQNSMFFSFENDYGIYLENSNLHGVKTSATDVVGTPTIRACYNAKAGLYAVNSKINITDEIDLHSNGKGAWLVDSELKTHRMFYQYNTEEGLLAEGSKIVHGKLFDTTPATPRVDTNSTLTYAVDGVAYDYDVFYFSNDRNIVLRNSEYKPLYRDNMPNELGAQLVACHTGTESSYFKPAITLENSVADLIHCRLSTTKSRAPYFTTEINPPINPSLGTAINMENSKVALLGTEHMATVITGPTQNADHNGLYVAKNSTCRISGPTYLQGFKRSIIVDLNSVLDVCPHEHEVTHGHADDAFDLLDNAANHTSLEILSNGICITADNDSVVNMRDLGSSVIKYPDSLRDVDYTRWANLSGYHHGGGVVLAPNDPDLGINAGAGNLVAYGNAPNTFAFQSSNFQTIRPYNYYYLGGAQLDNENWIDISEGGVCLDAHNNSTVNLFNVSFHTGNVNADGIFHDPDVGIAGCNQLRIWSFGSGASLNASLLACSGLYPSLAGYHGPRSVYFSGSGENSANIAYTAFRAFPYGYTAATSGTKLLKYPEGKATREFGSVNLQDYVGSSVGYGTSPYVSGLAVLDYFGYGQVVNGHESFPGGDYTDYIRSTAESRYDTTELETKLGLSVTQGSRWWGASGYENQGPFRLYLEPDPICQYMTYLSGHGGIDNNRWGAPSAVDALALSSDNRPYQTIAQGYHLSGPVIMDYYFTRFWRPDMLYYKDNLGDAGYADSIEVSGYPDIADLVRPENYNIKLDESAAHMFANAKHCSIPFLGRPPLVEIYRNSSEKWGSRMGRGKQLTGYGKSFKVPHTYNHGRK